MAPLPTSSRAMRSATVGTRLNGYLARSELPEGAAIHDAPAEDPIRPMNREEYIAWLRNKGLDVIEKGDGSFTISKPRRDEP